jgi:hypothetical protein
MEEDRLTTPYPEDPDDPRSTIYVLPSGQEAARGYIPVAPGYTPTTNIRRTNTAPAQNPPNPPNPGPAAGVIAQQPNNARKEVRMNMPPEFDGDRKKYRKFKQAVVLYLSVNRHIYTDDEAKIGFTLSYINDKEAAQWRESWIENNTQAGTLYFPHFDDFMIELDRAFSPIDAIGDAMHKLRALKQGSKSAEELITEFNLLCGQAGILTSGDTTLISLFQPALNKPLLEKILDSETIPTTIDGWKNKAIQLDNNYRRKMAILGKTRENRGQMNTGRRFFRPSNQQIQAQMKDPNAMDVDALSIKQREEAMKKGACFGCGEIGHISRNCPKKRQGGYGGQGGNARQTGQSGASKTTWTKGKDLLAHIRTLTTGLPANELEELMKEAEETGF